MATATNGNNYNTECIVCYSEFKQYAHTPLPYCTGCQFKNIECIRCNMSVKVSKLDKKGHCINCKETDWFWHANVKYCEGCYKELPIPFTGTKFICNDCIRCNESDELWDWSRICNELGPPNTTKDILQKADEIWDWSRICNEPPTTTEDIIP